MNNIDKIIQRSHLPYVKEYNNSVVAFVHAKGTSTRVISKNKRMLGDMPLFCHAIHNALNSAKVDIVVIDSDDDEILSIGKEHGALPLKRPPELANNNATGDDLAYWQASNFPLSDICIQVVPTAPFLKPESIDNSIKILLNDRNLSSVVGVYEEAFYKWENGKPTYYNDDGTIPNSFELGKTIYETTGMYANHTKTILKLKKRLNPESCKPYLLSRIETIDINTEDDFDFATIVWNGLKHLYM